MPGPYPPSAESRPAGEGREAPLVCGACGTVLQAGGKDIATAEDVEKALWAQDAAGGIRLLVTDPSGGKRFVFVKSEK